MVDDNKITPDIVKGLFGKDMLKDDTIEMSNIRCNIVKDRNYCVPEWFHEYITHEDMMGIINEILTNIDITQEAKDFIIKHEKMGHVKDYDRVSSMIFASKRFDMVGHFNSEKMCHCIKQRIGDIGNDDIIACVNSICSVSGKLPRSYIYLYLIKTVSKHWYFSSREKLANALVMLINQVNYDNLNAVYSAIYTAKIIDMEKSEIPYNKFIYKYNGTWFKPSVRVIDLIRYIDNYLIAGCSGGVYVKPMDDAIFPILNKIVASLPTDQTIRAIIPSLVKSLVKACMINPNNIKFLHHIKDNVSIDSADLVLLLGDNFDICMLDDLEIYYNLFDNVCLPDQLMRYVRNGFDITKIVPHIDRLADSTNICEFVRSITPENLAILAEFNPIVYRSSHTTLIDMIMSNLHKFNAGMIDTIKLAFASNGNIYDSLLPQERAILYFDKSSDVNTICAKYPTIIKYVDNVSFADISMMYRINPDIIHYIEPTLISSDLLISHIRTNGYTKLYNIGEIGLENVFGIHDMGDIIKQGKGIGHVLDFRNIEYRNAILMYLV